MEVDAAGDEVADPVEAAEWFLDPEVESDQARVVFVEFPAGGHYKDEVGVNLYELKGQCIASHSGHSQIEKGNVVFSWDGEFEGFVAAGNHVYVVFIFEERGENFGNGNFIVNNENAPATYFGSFGF